MDRQVLDWSQADPDGIRYSQALQIPGIEGQRPLSLWLPPGFEQAPERWPLAIFFDGQNIFGDQGTLAGGWQMHQTLQQRLQAGKQVPVIVGIHHGPQRESELSPFKPFEGLESKAQHKLEWLIHGLLPELRTQLGLTLQAAQTLIGGSSLGGLLALYALFHYPAHFGKALVMSPALWPDRFAIFQDIMLCQIPDKARIYLDHGHKEGHEHFGQLLFEQTRLMADLLEVLGFSPGRRLYWNPDPEGEHNERSWARRLPAAFEFLFGDSPCHAESSSN